MYQGERKLAPDLTLVSSIKIIIQNVNFISKKKDYLEFRFFLVIYFSVFSFSSFSVSSVSLVSSSFSTFSTDPLPASILTSYFAV